MEADGGACHASRRRAMPTPGVYAFEEIDENVSLMPLAARRVLDAVGRKLSLEAWLSLPVGDRRQIVMAGAGERVDASVCTLIEAATPRPSSVPPVPEPDAGAVPPAVAASLGPTRQIDDQRWRLLRPLDRYVLAKYVEKPESLARAYAEMNGVKLTHITRTGDAHMIDVAEKNETRRRASASACVRTTGEVIAAVLSGRVPKGDVLAVARVAGILAAKRTPELVPLCHPVRTTGASIEFESDLERGEIRVRATVEAVDRTGVEMEAMVAASIASLTVYDMIKSADRWAAIDRVRLDEKSGGKSGDVARPPERR
jgi:cyclic pyranopterin phosphate synthase